MDTHQTYTASGAIQIDTKEDIDVAWARRQDTIRGILKLFRVIVSSVQRHAKLTQQLAQVSAAQLWALWELERAPGLRVLDLAKLMAIHVAAAEAIVSDLEVQGLVRVVASDLNPKSRRLALTDNGRSRLAHAPVAARGMVATALDQLDDASLNALVASLQPLVGALPFKDSGAALSPLTDLVSGGPA